MNVGGTVLIVDDLHFNLKLLETMLKRHYYHTVTAISGMEALMKVESCKPDLILLDAMMPDMTGFEMVSLLRNDSKTAHIPVIIVTALSTMEHRINALSLGANDFISKPISESPLIARVNALIRMKLSDDELRTCNHSLSALLEAKEAAASVIGSEVLLVDDDLEQIESIRKKLGENGIITSNVASAEAAFEKISCGDTSLIIINSQLLEVDHLRFCAQIRNQETLRRTPIMVLVPNQDEISITGALLAGANDYAFMPLEFKEFTLRVVANIKRKRAQDVLYNQYLSYFSFSTMDDLTGLHNRRALTEHLNTRLIQATKNNENVTLLMLDIDNFKGVNDKYGHEAGDEVLRQVGARITECLRKSDFCARYGGEEFAIIPSEPDLVRGEVVAQRLLEGSKAAFKIDGGKRSINCSWSIGVHSLRPGEDDIRAIISNTDYYLRQAKSQGRNRYCSEHNTPPPKLV